MSSKYLNFFLSLFFPACLFSQAEISEYVFPESRSYNLTKPIEIPGNNFAIVLNQDTLVDGNFRLLNATLYALNRSAEAIAINRLYTCNITDSTYYSVKSIEVLPDGDFLVAGSINKRDIRSNAFISRFNRENGIVWENSDLSANDSTSQLTNIYMLADQRIMIFRGARLIIDPVTGDVTDTLSPLVGFSDIRNLTVLENGNLFFTHEYGYGIFNGQTGELDELINSFTDFTLVPFITGGFVNDEGRIILCGFESESETTIKSNYIVVAYDSSGTELWRRKYGEPDKFDDALGVVFDNYNEPLVLLSHIISNDSSIVMCTKLSSEGDSLFSYRGILLQVESAGQLLKTTLNEIAITGEKRDYSNPTPSIKTFFRIFNMVEPAPICITSVSENSTGNDIIWEKRETFGLGGFILYKEIISNQFDSIAFIHCDSLSAYTDSESDPRITSYRYQLQSVDPVGNKGAKSSVNRTIHLQMLNEGQFQWNQYEIDGQPTPVAAFDFYRDNQSDGNWQLIYSLPGSNTTFTDLDYNLFPDARYRVVADLDKECTPVRNFSNTQSNIYDKDVVTHLKNVAPQHLHIFPNPSTEYVTIKSDQPINEGLIVNDITGRIIYKSENESVQTNINCSHWMPGVYFIGIENNMQFAPLKFVKF